MRERELSAAEQRREQAKCFEVIKEIVDVVLSEPILRREFENALKSPRLSEEEQQIQFDAMVERSAKYCLFGDPRNRISPEYQCHAMVEMVDFLAHARPALERAVVLYREAGKTMPAPLRKWRERPGTAPPRRRGPRAVRQDWTAMRDHIMGMAIGGAVEMQQELDQEPVVPIGRACSSGENWRKKPSICRAVVEVLEERYGDNRDYHLPTYNMVWNAWVRYRREINGEGKSRPGRSLLPPKGLASLVRPDGINTKPLQRHLRKISQDHLTRRF